MRKWLSATEIFRKKLYKLHGNSIYLLDKIISNTDYTLGYVYKEFVEEEKWLELYKEECITINMNGDEQYNSPLLYYGFFGGNRNEEGWIWRSWYFETYFFSKNTNEYYTPERKDIWKVDKPYHIVYKWEYKIIKFPFAIKSRLKEIVLKYGDTIDVIFLVKNNIPNLEKIKDYKKWEYDKYIRHWLLPALSWRELNILMNPFPLSRRHH